MQSAFHITTKVLPGNRIEIQLPSNAEGEEVDVFVVLATKSSVQVDAVAKDSVAALARIRSRPRVDPTQFGLPDTTVLIREDRDR